MKTVYTSTFNAHIVLELLKKEKSLSQLAGEYKVHPNTLPEWRTMAVKHLASLFDKSEDRAKLRASHDQHVEDLYAQIGCLTTQLAWIKKNLASTLTKAERRSLVDRDAADVPLTAQANLLSRSSLYDTAAPHVREPLLTNQKRFSRMTA